MGIPAINPNAPGNKILDLLPASEFERLRVHLRPAIWQLHEVIYENGSRIEFAYFPLEGTLSALTVMHDGSAIEVATIGFEGMVGLPTMLGSASAPYRVIVQIPGHGLQIRVDRFREEVDRGGRLRTLMQRYCSAYLSQISQSVACNGLHTVQQRCCRWLLMTLDRVRTNEIGLTHEFLAIMLGVRRASVTEVLRPFKEKGLVQSRRGTITVVDRDGLEAAVCECYQRVKDEYDRVFSE